MAAVYGKCDRRQYVIFFGLIVAVAIIMIPTIWFSSKGGSTNAASRGTTLTTAEKSRLDCLPDYFGKTYPPTKESCQNTGCTAGPSEEEACRQRGCRFEPTGHQYVPDCFIPVEEFGYRMVGEKQSTELGFEVQLQLKGRGLFADNVQIIRFAVEMRSNEMMRFKFYDPTSARYEVPIQLHMAGTKARNPRYDIVITNTNPFSFQIVRRSNRAIIWDTGVGGLNFGDQFLQIATKLPSRNVYGLGENPHKSFRHDLNFKTWGVFARDQPPSFFGEDKNLYGTHLFYTCLENDGQFHGVFLLNSNAMDYTFTDAPMLTYRTIGGILDFFVFLGPTGENVVQQYTKLIGRPYMPPYWSLGFQLCRYGYNNISNLKETVERTQHHRIPHDVQYADIDHMEERKDFTVDDVNFPGLSQYFEDLRSSGMKTVIILDPGIITNVSGYRPFDLGKEMDVFIRWPAKEVMPEKDYEEMNSTVMLGYVWPKGKVVFPDFFLNETREYWKNLTVEHYRNIKFDGLWIDMNEPANFGTNDERPFNWPEDAVPYWSLRCPQSKWDDPPYRTWAASAFDKQLDRLGRLSDKTLCMVARQGKYTHYDVHSLYGWSQTEPTLRALRAATNRRGLVLSRSTFPGSGKWAGHWLGDNESKWKDLHESIIGMLEFNLFGIPYIGADICGFFGESNAELCGRWMQLGAFYPFSRNHNGEGYKPQDPGYYGGQTATLSREALQTRYRLLPYLYTLFHIAHTMGNTVVRPLLNEFPSDEQTWDIDRQFMWGQALLISPILEKGQTQLDFYLPRGRWYDFYSGAVHQSDGRIMSMGVTPNTPIQLHVRGGFILPAQEPANNTHYSRQNPFGLIVALNPEGSAIGDLYWDDGESIDTYETGAYFYAKFRARQDALSMNVQHNAGVAEIENRIIDDVLIFGVEEEPAWLYVNVNVSHTNFTYDKLSKVLSIKNLQLNVSRDFTITWRRMKLPSVEEACRLNCAPEIKNHFDNETRMREICETRHCLWSPVAENPNVPACYIDRTNFGYTMVKNESIAFGKRYHLRWLNTSSLFGSDIKEVTMDVFEIDEKKLRVKIYDPSKSRYEVPVPVSVVPTNASRTSYDIVAENDAFGVFFFKIIRKSTATIIWDTSVNGFASEDQFLQIATRLPTSYIYGFGENRHFRFRHDDNYRTWPMFSRDQAPGWGDYGNLYSVHPFYMNTEDDEGRSNGVLLLNSNAMEITVQPSPILTYRTTGGILDFYFVIGDSPENVVQLYTEIIGRSYLPPYWSLGFQLCRYGYNSLENLQAAVQRTIDADIPLDVQYADIDHMDERKDFTWDEKSFGGLPNYIDDLKNEGVRFIIILDPALIANETFYRPYELGKMMNAYISWPDGQSPDFEYHKDNFMLGYVWPKGRVVFPDFLNSNTRQFWHRLIVDHHRNLSFDGLWIDMNEPANFGTNEDRPFNWPEDAIPYWSLKCPESILDDPPFKPVSIFGSRLSDKTLCMVAQQNGTSYNHYDVHSLYGWSQTEPTLRALQSATKERGIVISRSTYPSSGRYAGHWLGDNESKWSHMRDSIIGIMEFSLFGIPYIGADICGFFGDATPELCQRWMQLGAFYTFSRNHNGFGQKEQDPAFFGQNVAESSKKVLETRYTLLPYLYTLFYLSRTRGDTVIRPLMHQFPSDLGSRDVDDQFMWGPGLMIAPVLDEGKTSVDVYFPTSGRWFDFYTGAPLASDHRVQSCSAPRDTIPLFLNGGTIIVTQEPANNTYHSRKNPIGLIVAPAKDGTAFGQFFWDDGTGIDTIEKKAFNLAYFSYSETSSTIEMAVQRSDGPDLSNLPLTTLRVLGVEKKPSSVRIDGSVHDSPLIYNEETQEMIVEHLRITLHGDCTVTWE